jgi:acyl-CoA thioesterase
MERRAVVGGSLLAGLSTLMSPHDAEAAAAAADSDLEGVSYSIDQLRKTVERQFANVYTAKWHGVARIREQQHLWMKSTQKYPDFIEIGIDVWDNIYDWHVVHQQPINMTRLTDGRYTMVFMFTTLLLRPDQAADFVGYAFDIDTARRTR